jgi:UDP-N-acetylglucosamine transferase subunit ALG13
VSAVTVEVAGAGPLPATLRVVVTVGTDHHPFDRLIGWVNDWLAAHPGHAETFFVQTGTSSVPPNCPAADYLDTQKLDDLLDEADVLVCHGGPASIADAWRRGLVPIAVPRLHRLGEHVDDHQLDFCAQVAELGHVRLARTAEDFAALLSAAGTGRRSIPVSRPPADVDATVARFGALVDELVSRPRRRPSLLNLARRRRPGPAGPAGGPHLGGPVSGESSTWRAAGTPVSLGLSGEPKKEQG